MGDDPALWLLLAASTLATYVWRGGGLVLSRAIAPDGRLMRLFAAIAYATLAALISRVVFLPAGILEETTLAARLAATALALLVFFLAGMNILLGVVAGGVGLLVFVSIL